MPIRATHAARPCVFRGRAWDVALTVAGGPKWSERYASVCCVCLFQGAAASDIRCSFVSTHRTSGRPSSARGASPAYAMRWRGLTPLRFAKTRPTWQAPLSQQPPCSWCEPESSAFLRGILERARFWSDHIKLSSRQLPPSAFFDALALIQGDTMGLPPSERERRAVEHRVRWTTDGSAPPARGAALSPFVGDDVVAEYVALTLDCENGLALTPWERERVLARHPIPAIQFRLHVCAADERGWRTLLETDDRWVDTLAIRGRLAMVRYPSPEPC